jgi:hypothetical protein
MRVRLSILAVLAAALAFSCASGSSRPPEVTQPEVRVARVGTLFFGSGDTAPITFNVAVHNRANVPLTLKQIELTSPGMMQYEIERVTRFYGDRLAPGEEKVVVIGTRAFTDRTRLDATEPLNVRAIVDFEYEGQRFREIYLVGVLE